MDTEYDISERMPTLKKPWRKSYAILLRPDEPQTGDHVEHVTQKPKMIGIIGTKFSVEIAYRLHPNYWNKGYMSEALAIFLKLFWSLEGMFSSIYYLSFC